MRDGYGFGALPRLVVILPAGGEGPGGVNRVPLVLRYYSELSYDEIAQQLNLQRNYVAALIFRAKQELRRKLSRGGK